MMPAHGVNGGPSMIRRERNPETALAWCELEADRRLLS